MVAYLKPFLITFTPLFLLSACQDNQEASTPVGGFDLVTQNRTDFFVLNSLTAFQNGAADKLRYANINRFYFNSDGYLTNVNEQALLVFPANPDGTPASTGIALSTALKVDNNGGTPEATSEVKVSVNLPASASELSAEELDTALESACSEPDPNLYHAGAGVTIYDDLGTQHTLSLKFIKVSDEFNTWEVRGLIEEGDNSSCARLQPLTTEVLDFDQDGNLDLGDDADLDGIVSTNGGVLQYDNFVLDSGASDLAININFTSTDNQATTALDDNFTVKLLQQDGSYNDQIDKVSIDRSGKVTVVYADETEELIGRVVMAKFPSPSNLGVEDNDLWSETEASGEPSYGVANSDNIGTLETVEFDY